LLLYSSYLPLGVPNWPVILHHQHCAIKSNQHASRETLQNMIIAYITYIIHHILWQYHITNTRCKNKLDASNLLIACFTWLVGATHKNDSYLRKATTVILWLPTSGVNLMTTIVRETGIHQPHVWNKPHVKCGAGLTNEVA
jgi:hypothetical protein